MANGSPSDHLLKFQSFCSVCRYKQVTNNHGRHSFYSADRILELVYSAIIDLTNWILGNMVGIINVSQIIFMSSTCDITLRWMTQNTFDEKHWLRWWLVDVWQEAITWASVDPELCLHIMSLGHSELNDIMVCEIPIKPLWSRMICIELKSSSKKNSVWFWERWQWS